MARILTSRKPSWYPDWKGETVVVVCSGPSAIDAPLDMAIGKAKFVAVNDSWRLCPWCDALVGVDFQWWEVRKGATECEAPIKWSVDGRVKHFPEWNIKYLQCDKPTDRLILDMVGTIGWGGNSGFCALNWVAQLEPALILLVGFDMQITKDLLRGRLIHWHKPHGVGLSNPTYSNVARWRRAVDSAAKTLKDAGIKVINTSPDSALKDYPKMSFESAIALSKPRELLAAAE